MQHSGRLRLRPWLEEQIQSGRYPGVSWLDQVNHTASFEIEVLFWKLAFLPLFSKLISQHESSKSHGNMQLVMVGVLTKMQHFSEVGPCTLVGAQLKLWVYSTPTFIFGFIIFIIIATIVIIITVILITDIILVFIFTLQLSHLNDCTSILISNKLLKVRTL